jgi:hypothetical protein
LEIVSLLDDERYSVTDSTVYRFEFLPYCLVGNGAAVAAWDIDEIKVFGGCGVMIHQTESIAGRVISIKGEGINHVEITNSHDEAFSDAESVFTHAQGEYAIESLTGDEALYVKGSKEDHFLNGVSTLDMVQIQKHLLGIQPFTSLIEYIAADVNGDELINALDLVELRKCLLGYPCSFDNDNTWKFGVLPMNLKAIDFREFREVAKLVEPLSGIQLDFLGVKVGDVNGSAKVNH